jgi:hypothetical protein
MIVGSEVLLTGEAIRCIAPTSATLCGNAGGVSAATQQVAK